MNYGKKQGGGDASNLEHLPVLGLHARATDACTSPRTRDTCTSPRTGGGKGGGWGDASNLEHLPVFRALREGNGRMHQSMDEGRIHQSADAKKIAWEGDKVPSHKQSQSVGDRHRDY